MIFASGYTYTHTPAHTHMQTDARGRLYSAALCSKGNSRRPLHGLGGPGCWRPLLVLTLHQTSSHSGLAPLAFPSLMPPAHVPPAGPWHTCPLLARFYFGSCSAISTPILSNDCSPAMTSPPALNTPSRILNETRQSPS